MQYGPHNVCYESLYMDLVYCMLFLFDVIFHFFG